MNAADGDFVIRRILAAVKTTSTSSTVVETAALLAREFGAELDSVFVEDINLLRLAGLPFAREMTWSSAMELHLDYARMERTLRGNAAHVRQTVVNVTTQLKLHGSLRILRGQVARELLDAAQDVDLIILGKGRGTGGEHIGTIARQVAQEARCSVLLLATKSSTRPYTTVMTVFSGDEPSRQLLNAAGRLARAVHKNLLVVIPATGMSDFQQLRELSRQALRHGPLLVTYLAVASQEACFSPSLLRTEGVGMVVVSGAAPDTKIMEARLTGLECALLLVR